jgi:hypothetical protein
MPWYGRCLTSAVIMFRSPVVFAAPATRVTFCAAGNVVVHTGATPVRTTLTARFSEEGGLRQGRMPATDTVSHFTLSPADRVHEALHVTG